jgi:hypothetical protein
MAKRVRSWNKAVYERYLKSGRGQGEGSSYLPWVSVHDFSSQGTISRVAGHKTGRVHHFLSRNELNYFFLLEWSDNVLDIREQFPLSNIAMAADIARAAGITYPRDNVSGFPYVLTCDFMITTPDGMKARTIKCSAELRNRRTVEKLEIERRYWAVQGVDWAIVTEHEIPLQKCRNIEWLYSSAVLPASLDMLALQQCMLALFREGLAPTQLVEGFDALYDLPPGSGLRLFKHLVWTKQVVCDMNANLPALFSSDRFLQEDAA